MGSATATPPQPAAAGPSADGWLSYGHGHTEQRYSPLDQIHRCTIRRLGLGLARSRNLSDATSLQATPLAVDP